MQKGASKMKIIPIIYARSVLPECMVFYGGSRERTVPINFTVYYIETAKKRILVDAGCDTMPGFEMRDFIGPVKALADAGIDKDNITDVVLTHAHHDHIEGVKHFGHAVIHIQSDEYEIGKGYIPKGFSVNRFDDVLELCEGVRVLKIGGHSKGSCIVEIDDGDKKYVICGDECYVRRCLDEKIPTGASVSREISREFVEKYSSPEYIALLCHDE